MRTFSALIYHKGLILFPQKVILKFVILILDTLHDVTNAIDDDHRNQVGLKKLQIVPFLVFNSLQPLSV